MSNQPLPAPWLSMHSAPKDGRLIRLLVSFDENAIDDGDEPFATIGQNNFQNDQVDRWQFVGWNWTHDEFTDGQGTPLGWLPMLDEQSTAARDVLSERNRQIVEKGWTPAHDDEHDPGELTRAAAAYLLSAFPRSTSDCGFAARLWPWDNGLNPKSKREDVVRAAALALAAIERIDRQQSGSPEGLNQPQKGDDQ